MNGVSASHKERLDSVWESYREIVFRPVEPGKKGVTEPLPYRLKTASAARRGFQSAEPVLGLGRVPALAQQVVLPSSSCSWL